MNTRSIRTWVLTAASISGAASAQSLDITTGFNTLLDNCAHGSTPDVPWGYWTTASSSDPSTNGRLTCLETSTVGGWNSQGGYPDVKLMDGRVTLHPYFSRPAVASAYAPGWRRARVTGAFEKFWPQPTNSRIEIVRHERPRFPPEQFFASRDAIWQMTMEGEQAQTFPFDLSFVVRWPKEYIAAVSWDWDGTPDWERAYVEMSIELWDDIADMNGDGLRDLTDVTTFVNAYRVNSRRADMNADNLLDLTDINLFIQQFTR